MTKTGNLPVVVDTIDLDPVEMMFWMYLPISVPQSHSYHLPENLKHLAPIVSAAKAHDPSGFFLRYVYLTAKTLWVEGNYIGNRPGWHIDGFNTDDVNYIWSDREPTEFVDLCGELELPTDCHASMVAMEAIGNNESFWGNTVTYPDKTLLRLDNTVIHRSPVSFVPGLRTFVKVSLSHDQYDLKGNSINHLLPETRWPLVDRQCERNHPSSKAA